MTQAMLHVDRARTRLPLKCIVIAVLVWTVSITICFTAWLLATNDSGLDSKGANSVRGPQSNPSAAKSRDPYGSDLRDRPGRRF